MIKSSPIRSNKLFKSDLNHNSPNREQNNSKIIERLEAQKHSDKLSLADLFIGDEAVTQIASFLKLNNSFKSIELRGNNISGSGFGIVCEALKGFRNLETISAEWNNIGSDISGIQIMNTLIRKSPSITTIDLRNNKIGPNFGPYLAETLKESSYLQTLDLRWNELGNEGGRPIINVLSSMKNKIHVDLSGNKISEELFAELTNPSSSPLLNPNFTLSKVQPSATKSDIYYRAPLNTVHKQTISTIFNEPLPIKNTIYQTPIIQQATMIQQAPIAYQTPLLTKSTPSRDISLKMVPRQSYRPDLDLKEIQMRYEIEAREVQEKYEHHIEAHVKMSEALVNIEAQLFDEKNHSISLEHNLEDCRRQLDLEIRTRTDIERRCSQLNSEVEQRDYAISELENTVRIFQQDLDRTIGDNERLKDELGRTREDSSCRIRQIEQELTHEIQNLSNELQNMKRHEERMSIDHQTKIIELNRDWDNKLRAHESQFMEMEDVIRQLENEITGLSGHIQSLKREKEESLIHQERIIKEAENNKFQVSIRALEGKLKQLEEIRDMNTRKNHDLSIELQRTQKDLGDFRMVSDSEIKKFRYEIEDYKNQIVQLTSALNKIKADVFDKENIIKRMEEAVYHFEKEIQHNKDIHNEQLQRLMIEHDKDVARWEQTEQNLNLKVIDMERMYKNSLAELHQAQNEYNRLSDILQGNVSQAISRTLLEYKGKS